MAVPNRFLRATDGEASATNMELFFDLVYVFAVTQMSHHLLGADHPTWTSAGQTVILLGLVWSVWVYTTWVTNWLDPERDAVRLLLLVLMLCSLGLSAALPEAFGHWGYVVGILYALMQIGRSAVSTVLAGDTELHLNFARITVWCTLSGVVAVAGGLADPSARAWLWIGVIVVDLIGGLSSVGFWVPGLGRSTSAQDWRSVRTDHFAERCQGFILIALGESLVVIGSSMSGLLGRGRVDGLHAMSSIGSFAGVAALWWIYFDNTEDATGQLRTAGDPATLIAWAFHRLHPVMIAGIIVTAAADELVFEAPGERAHGPVLWTVLGGSALYLVGHALYKATLFRRVPVPHVVAVAVLAVLGLVGSHLSAFTVGLLDGVVLLGLCVADRVVYGKKVASR